MISVVGAAQDVAALARRVVAPVRERLVRGGERGLGVVDRGVGDLDERLAGRRVLDGERPAAARGAPLAPDEELLCGTVSRTVASAAARVVVMPSTIARRGHRLGRYVADRLGPELLGDGRRRCE